MDPGLSLGTHDCPQAFLNSASTRCGIIGSHEIDVESGDVREREDASMTPARQSIPSPNKWRVRPPRPRTRGRRRRRLRSTVAP